MVLLKEFIQLTEAISSLICLTQSVPCVKNLHKTQHTHQLCKNGLAPFNFYTKCLTTIPAENLCPTTKESNKYSILKHDRHKENHQKYYTENQQSKINENLSSEVDYFAALRSDIKPFTQGILCQGTV